jgi:hypothetical protein
MVPLFVVAKCDKINHADQINGVRGLSSKIVLVPAVKRVGIIRRWARNIATYRKIKARENTIRIRLETFATSLRRVGIEEGVITRETASMETALRVEITRLMQYARDRSI